MSESQNVVLQMRFEGADKAAADMDRLAQRTKGAGEAAKQAEQNYQRMTGAAGGGQTALIAQLKSQGVTNPQFIQSALATYGASTPPPPGVPWGPVGTSALSLQMQAYQRQLANTPAPPGVGPTGGRQPGGEDGLPGRFQQLGSRYQSQLLSVIGLQAAGQAFEGFGRGLERVSEKAMSAGTALGVMGEELVKSIPIIGHFVEGMSKMADVFSGTGTARAASAEFLSHALPGIDLQTRAQSLRFGAAAEVAGMAQQREFAGLRVDAAQAALGRLTPDVLSGFRESGGVGSAKQALQAALTHEDATGRIAGAARRQFDQDRQGGGDVAARTRAANAAVVAAEDRLARLTVENEKSLSIGGGATAGALAAAPVGAAIGSAVGPLGAAIGGGLFALGGGIGGAIGAGQARGSLDKNLIDAEEQARVARQQFDKAVSGNLDAQNHLRREGLELTKLERDAAEASLKVEQARLNVRGAENDKARRSAEFAGGAIPGELEVQLAVARQIKQSGIGSVPPQLADQAAQNPAIRDFIRGAREAAGAANPTQQAIEREFGKPPANQFDQIADDLARRAAEVQVDGAKRLAGVMDQHLGDLPGILIEIVDTKLAEFNNKLRLEFLKGK